MPRNGSSPAPASTSTATPASVRAFRRTSRTVSETIRRLTQIGTVSIDWTLIRTTPTPPMAVPSDHRPVVAGDHGEGHGAENAEQGADDPEEEQIAEQMRALVRGPGDREFAAADGSQAGIGDPGDDAEHGRDGGEPAEVGDPEVPQEERRGGEAERGADRVADPADKPAAHDAAARLGRAQEVESRLVGVGDHTGGTWARRSICRCQRWRIRPRRSLSTIALPRPSGPSEPTESTT